MRVRYRVPVWPASCAPQVLTLLFPKYCTEGAQIAPRPSDYHKIYNNVTQEMKPLSANYPAVRARSAVGRLQMKSWLSMDVRTA